MVPDLLDGAGAQGSPEPDPLHLPWQQGQPRKLILPQDPAPLRISEPCHQEFSLYSLPWNEFFWGFFE